MKKKKIIILTFTLIMLLASEVYATHYVLSGDEKLDVYEYGADFYGKAEALEDPEGGLTNITGVKVRCKIYKNGSLDTDTSSYDTYAPYRTYKRGSCVSTQKSNTWKHSATYYYKKGSSSYYIPMVTETETKSN
jgi:hypothetical protein